jgi:hypothetical protein
MEIKSGISMINVIVRMALPEGTSEVEWKQIYGEKIYFEKN